MARAKLRSAASALCRNDVRMFLDHVVVGQGKIKVTGSKSQIENALVAKMGATEIVPDLNGAGAAEKTRTSTGFRPQRPQRCASTSSATAARHVAVTSAQPG